MVDIGTNGHRLWAAGMLDDLAESPFRDALKKVLASGNRTVEMDLTRVEAITSACVGALVGFWIDLKTAGRALVLSVSPHVRKTLDVTGVAAALLNARTRG